MRVDHVFRTLMFAVTELLLLALWLAGAPGPFCLVVAAGVALQLVRALRGAPLVLGGWSQIGLYLLALAYLVSVRWRGGDGAMAVAQMLTLLAALAFFGTLDRGGAMFALLCQLLSLLMLQAAGKAGGALALAVLVGLPLLGLEWIALAIYESQRLGGRHQRRLQRAKRLPRQLRQPRLGRGFAGVAGLILLAFLTCSAGAYLLLPRPYSNQPTSARGDDDFSTKYTSLRFPDSIEMGSLDSKHRESFVASVRLRYAGEIYRARGQALYWKLRTYDQYNGRRWRGEPRTRRVRDADDGTSDGRVTVGDPDTPAERLLEQSVRVVPFTPQMLPVLDPAHSIERAEVFRFEGGGLVDDKVTRLDAARMGRTTGFTAWSRMARAFPDPDERATIADQRYYQLPGDYLDARALSQGVLRGMETDPMRVAALVDHLRSSYRYAREFTEPPAGTDPVAHFLFKSKVGHCELFAGALALMLRCQGIPARVVGGFMGAKWEELGAYYRVTQGDAHAWVEVHYQTTGWVRYDPTPAAVTRRDDDRAGDSEDGAGSSAIGSDPQGEALRELLMMDARRRDLLLSNLLGSTWFHIAMAAMLLGIVLLVGRRWLASHVQATQRVSTSQARARPAASYFAEAVDLLERAELSRRRSETTGELGRRLAAEVPAAADAYGRLAELYRAQRFGPAEPPDAAEAEDWLDRLAAALGLRRSS